MQKWFVFGLVLLLTVATLAQDVDDVEEEAPAVRVRRGFGCPFNQYECHSHCRGIRGYKGGYCKGALKQTCKCY